jgi:hypothetical protein
MSNIPSLPGSSEAEGGVQLPNLGPIEQSKLFSQFKKLSMEIRLQIWEQTWPGPRLINIQLDIDGRNHVWGEPILELFDYPLQHESWDWKMKNEQHPVALLVCSESRRYTLQQFRQLFGEEGSISPYLNPKMDIIWLDWSQARFESLVLGDLLRYYGEEVRKFENLRVGCVNARNTNLLDATLEFFKAVRKIQVWSDDDPLAKELLLSKSHNLSVQFIGVQA